MEDLDGIAQNIIRLKLTHSERVQQARDHFHEQCAKFGGVMKRPSLASLRSAMMRSVMQTTVRALEALHRLHCQR